MHILVGALGVGLLLNNVHAIAAVVLSLRWRDAARTRNAARRCEYLTLGLAALYIAVCAIDYFAQPWPPELTPADRQRLTSNLIAEGIYNFALLCVAALIPCLVTVWLKRRARKL